MSSPPKETASAKEQPELKAGHPPAVKVAGGVRITQHKQNKEPEVPPTKEEIEEEAKKNINIDHRMTISGAVPKGDKDFPPEAVKKFHEKPEPTVQQPHTGTQRPIVQPRRHN